MVMRVMYRGLGADVETGALSSPLYFWALGYPGLAGCADLHAARLNRLHNQVLQCSVLRKPTILWPCASMTLFQSHIFLLAGETILWHSCQAAKDGCQRHTSRQFPRLGWPDGCPRILRPLYYECLATPSDYRETIMKPTIMCAMVQKLS